MVQPKNTFGTNFFLGQQALEVGNASQAFEYWLNCLDTLPKNLDSIRQLGHAFRSIGQISYAKKLIHETLAQHPDSFLLKADLANLSLDCGQAESAVELWLQLAKTANTSHDTETSLAFLGNALMGMEYTSLLADNKKTLAQQWGALATAWAQNLTATEKLPAWSARPHGEHTLRIGFISGDLCDHPVGFLLLPLLQNRTPRLWTPYIYDNRSRVDLTHQQLKSNVPANQWRDIGAQHDADAMRTILGDQLDILIDLSGHTGRNRLRLMAQRLAGKQLSWLGFSGTTGLTTIDGILLDTFSGKDCTHQFVEAIIPLDPNRFCFRPPFAPPLTPPPYLRHSYITFGSFNNTAKYNAPLLETWAQILAAVPESRLILKWRTFVDTHFCDTIRNGFAKRGVDQSRIELREFSTHRQMLDEYKDVDIALDPFPFNGGFTSLEALWMGLPLVTLYGNTPIGRQSASFLNLIGESNWVAKDIAGYIKIAKGLALNPVALQSTRSQQRYEIMDSELYDGYRFAKTFESLMIGGQHFADPLGSN